MERRHQPSDRARSEVAACRRNGVGRLPIRTVGWDRDVQGTEEHDAES